MEVHVGKDVTIGRIVRYTLTEDDALKANRRRTHPVSILERIERAVWPLGAQAHIGNLVEMGDVFPMMVTRVWALPGVVPDVLSVNGQVFLDGNDVLWATGVVQGDGTGQWQWPDVQPDVPVEPPPVAVEDVPVVDVLPEPVVASGG